MEAAITKETEQQKYITQQHWVVLLTPLFWALLSLIVFIKFNELWLFGFILAAFAIVTGFISAMTYVSAKFIITDENVYLRSGLFRMRQVRLALNEIQHVYAERTLLGRMLDYGMVIIVDDKQQDSKLKKVVKPRHFVSVLEKLIKEEEPDFGDQ